MRNNQLIILIITFGMLAQACKTASPVSSTGTETIPVLSQDTVKLTPQTPAIPYQPTAPQIHDLLHTRLTIAFDWEKEQVIGEAELQLKPYFYPITQVVLDAKNFEINQVELINTAGRQELTYEYDAQQLYITLDTIYTRQDTIWLAIDYVASPSDNQLSAQSAITSDKGLYFIKPTEADPDKPYQIWTQGEPEANSRWFPTLDQPNEKMTQELYITVDSQFVTLSNGVLIYARHNGDQTRTDYWKLDQPHAPYLVMVAVGDFAIVKDRWAHDSRPDRPLPLSYYVEPAYEPYAKVIFGATPEMLTFYSERFGYPFPWPKYSQIVVRDFVSGAMENTTASVFMDELHMDSRELIDQNWEYIIAHELAHHWFGDLVTCESWGNLPLNESFANYAEYLWQEYKYGKDQADYHALEELSAYLYESEVKQEKLIRSYFEQPRDMFDTHSYSKGGLILHMLRVYLGDEAFFEGLRAYLHTYAYQAVEADQLRLIFEQVSGTDLHWFFDQWFFASGHPQLSVSHRYTGDTLQVDVAQLQNLETTPLYTLPLYIDVWTASDYYRFDITLQEEQEVLYLPLSDEPLAVVFDGEHQLVGEINHSKTSEELYNQYLFSDKYYARYEALEAFGESPEDSLSRSLLLLAFEDTLDYLREEAIYSFADYIGEGLPEVAGKLTTLAEADSSPRVRAAALSVLASYDATQYTALFKSGLQDSSYSVVGSAIEGLLATGTDYKELLKPYYDSDQIDLVLPLADAAVLSADTTKYGWLRMKYQNLSGQYQWYVLQYLNEMLLYLDTNRQKEAIPELKVLAREHPESYMRMAGIQGLLFLLEDHPELEAEVREIMQAETDETLQQLYQEFK